MQKRRMTAGRMTGVFVNAGLVDGLTRAVGEEPILTTVFSPFSRNLPTFS